MDEFLSACHALTEQHVRHVPPDASDSVAADDCTLNQRPRRPHTVLQHRRQGEASTHEFRAGTVLQLHELVGRACDFVFCPLLAY